MQARTRLQPLAPWIGITNFLRYLHVPDFPVWVSCYFIKCMCPWRKFPVWETCFFMTVSSAGIKLTLTGLPVGAEPHCRQLWELGTLWIPYKRSALSICRKFSMLLTLDFSWALRRLSSSMPLDGRRPSEDSRTGLGTLPSVLLHGCVPGQEIRCVSITEGAG